MGKKRKRHAQPDAAPISMPSPATSNAPIALRAADVATTITTLNYLASNLDALQSKALRDLRAALHPIVEAQLKKYDPIDYASRVTAAFRAGRGADALLALEGLHARHQTVRQGTIQRWVRDCDTIDEASLRVKLLHAVLRAGKTAGGEEEEDDDDEGAPDARDASAAGDASVDEEMGEDAPHQQDAPGDATRGDANLERGGEQPTEPAQASTAAVLRLPGWTPHDSAEDLAGALAAAASAAGRVASAVTPCNASGMTAQQLGLRVVKIEPGAERQPPNHHDLQIFTCGTHVPLLQPAPRLAPELGSTRRVDVPGVPGAFVLLSVLSPTECATLATIAECIGYTPDHPLSRPAPSGIGACEWLLHEDALATLFERCAPHLPQELSGGRLAGINARCRFFRYTDAEQAVYRPHIDGSWPGSGLEPLTGNYVHDAFGDQRSRLTFLMYLNDGFDGGCTTFYMPSSGGTLRARGVQPRAGCVLCFPQGNTASLLHEGSAVTRGTKDVIRTDVLYQVPREPR